MTAMAFMDITAWSEQASMFDAGDYRLARWITKDPDPAKEWLLLIHGFPTCSWDWTPLWSTLEQHFNLAALDMLGFGLSDKPKDKIFTLMEQADFYEAFLAAQGMQSAHIFTHDYGVSVAQELLARHNEQSLMFEIKSICFLNGGLFPAQHHARMIQRLALTPLGPLLSKTMSRKRLHKTFNDVFGPDTQPSDAEIDGHWHFISHNQGEQLLHKLMRYIIDRRTYARRWEKALKESQCPLRLINGGKDPVSGVHLYEQYRETIPNADAVLLPEIGHYPHTEAPEDVWKAFASFHAIEI